jgi:hypothetical protein
MKRRHAKSMTQKEREREREREREKGVAISEKISNYTGMK